MKLHKFKKRNFFESTIFYYAKVDPEYLKNFSKMLNKNLEDLDDTKDTEDYNKEQSSKVVDRSLSTFMEAGQKQSDSGDMIRTEAFNDFFTSDKNNLSNYEKAISSGEYKLYPFSMPFSLELRNKFVLKTEKSDSFESLYPKMKSLLLKYCTDDIIEKIDNAVEKAKKRLKNTKLSIINPMVIKNNKKVRKLTDDEINALKLIQTKRSDVDIKLEKPDFFIEERNDDFDLVALKELIYILDGNNVDYFSIALGFFGKIMPELLNEGIDSVILKVIDEKLNTIQFVSLKKEYFKNQEHCRDFSPVMASNMLIQSFGIKSEDKKIITSRATGKEMSIVEYTMNDLFEENSKYYVLVDGCISVSSNQNYLDYEENVLNNKRVFASEVFLFEKRPEGLMNTRLFFTPYEYNSFHFMHHHGGVIFGSSDQSMHSCLRKMDDIKNLEKNILNLEWKESRDRSLNKELKTSYAYSPAMTAVRFHFFEIGDYSDELMKPEFKHVLLNTISSLYEMFEFTLRLSFFRLKNTSILFNDFKIKTLFWELVKNYQPLTKRFLLKNYAEKNVLEYDSQPTWWDDTGFEHETVALLNAEASIEEMNLIEKIEQEKGVDYDTAVRLFEAEKIAEIIKSENITKAEASKKRMILKIARNRVITYEQALERYNNGERLDE